ncbi:AI-2E family transporter [Galbitalea soli]|uniref:AI-2E family transporter n=1 Tax=Galbitalea soli TaxID=1268042 RepID=A0A7C9PM55_9MICO|nr:AI-2E family transporter [Galbitalea soli]NEM90665.1 AI-2E family transporter [Galbitalea soli]NYJ31383.1 putative PurR-regulated permease PerM [Galbitalea soli]
MKLWKARVSPQAAVGRKPLTGPDRKRAIEEAIPVPVEIAGQWSWRILVVIGVLVVFGYLIATLKDIVVPFMVAILVSALLVPFKQYLQRHNWPRWLAIVVPLVLTLLIVGGLLFIVIAQVRSGYPDLQARTVTAFDNFRTFLKTSPLQISDAQFSSYLAQIGSTLQSDSAAILSGALAIGTTFGHVLTGFLLALFATIFILIDGAAIWGWIVRIFPHRARTAVDGAGRAGWVTLTAFVRAQILVAAVDAIGIGLGAFVVGLFFGGFPLVIPIAIAVFLGSFIPVVGAVITGALAVIVALLYDGPIAAVIMLAVVLGVQELEGHGLQPFLMGSAVKVHGLAVVFAVAAGGFLAGIPGALFAVPIVAVVNVMVKYIASGRWRTLPHPEARDVALVADVVSSDE